MSERSTDCRGSVDSDNFCDAAGELFAPASRGRDDFRDIWSFRYDCLTAQGATVVGMTSQDGRADRVMMISERSVDCHA